MVSNKESVSSYRARVRDAKLSRVEGQVTEECKAYLTGLAEGSGCSLTGIVSYLLEEAYIQRGSSGLSGGVGSASLGGSLGVASVAGSVSGMAGGVNSLKAFFEDRRNLLNKGDNHE